LVIQTGFLQSGAAELTIANPSDDVQAIEVYLETVDTGIRITPRTFTLEAGARKKVSVQLERSVQNDTVKTNTVKLLAKPLLDSPLLQQSGINIPLEVRFEPLGWQELSAIIGIPLLLVLVLGSVYKVRKRKKNPTP
ncbi:MAG TPA: hypothetical protein VEA59_00575, partial [Patescibacteria group bacterium]|nr:hypothetical protein [Patescibacteria group bacterium]